ncbi:MAG: DUF3109 family protein [Rubricoccaceae bacterium]|nr:DUF3109 family protein [Rubricoccaceae bacterium]
MTESDRAGSAKVIDTVHPSYYVRVMFAVDHVLISDSVLEAPFSCNLGQCFGACCVHGDRGAPLEADECEKLEEVLPIIRDRLMPEARKVIEREGVWTTEEKGRYGTTTVGERECVFVRYDGKIAKCAIQEAYNEGRVGFEKPISCHLYPIRVEQHGTGEDLTEVLNYEKVDLCNPAVAHGKKAGLQLVDFLKRPLTRKYGPAWYTRFREAVEERRAVLSDALQR